MTATIAPQTHRICICQRGDAWLLTLTDGAEIFRRTRYETPQRALGAVARLLAAGHQVAFPSAYRALTSAAAHHRI